MSNHQTLLHIHQDLLPVLVHPFIRIGFLELNLQNNTFLQNLEVNLECLGETGQLSKPIPSQESSHYSKYLNKNCDRCKLNRLITLNEDQKSPHHTLNIMHADDFVK